ncbi:hypothetical protein [Flavobacterium soli]|uniref:hypothetical protein n=1 Tax=Flavobacterium soli TaxID=344881 RepID=UPI0003FC09BE|nr:hypothetical protein [Flavobacterium soli]
MRITLATTWVLDSRIHHSSWPPDALKKTIQSFLPNTVARGNPKPKKPYNGKASGLVEKNKVRFPLG